MSKSASLTQRVTKAKVAAHPDVLERARRGLQAFVHAMAQDGAPSGETVQRLADGSAALGIGRIGLSALNPVGLACAQGCAFCCILSGDDGGMLTEAEATALYEALSPLAGQPDGRAWHAKACAALDPETRSCRAYDARPMICRSYVSTDVSACEAVAQGEAAVGPGTLDPYHTYLAAIGLSRAALKGSKRVGTYALSRLTVAAVEGASLEDALSQSRHATSELDAELRRSKRNMRAAERRS